MLVVMVSHFILSCKHNLFLSHHLAVVDGEVEQETDELVARASRLVSECVKSIDNIFPNADGQGLVPVLSAFSFGYHQFCVHMYHLIMSVSMRHYKIYVGHDDVKPVYNSFKFRYKTYDIVCVKMCYKICYKSER